MRTWIAVALATSVLTHAVAAIASPTETGETGLVTVPTTAVLPPSGVSISVAENGEVDASQTSTGEIEINRTQFTLGLGLFSGLEFAAQLPYVQFERNVPGNRHTDDIGGLRLGFKYRLLDESAGAPVGAALLAAVVLGTGRDSFPAIIDRNSAWGRRETYEVMGILDKVLWHAAGGADATLTLNAGGLFFDKPASFAVQNQTLQFQRRFVGPNATFNDPFEFAAAVNVPVLADPQGQMDLLTEFRGNTGIIDELNGALPTWLFTGLRFTIGSGLGVQGGVDFGLSGFLEPYRFIAALTYATPA